MRAASEPPANPIASTTPGGSDAAMEEEHTVIRLDEDSESDIDEEELKRLRARAEKRHKKAELARLRRELEEDDHAPLMRGASENRILKRPISGDLSAEIPKHLRPAAPDTYSGNEGAKGLQSFLTVLELYFDAIPIPVESDEVRVRHAGAYLRGEAARSYLREKSKITTWEEFTTFLKGTIKDPASRLASATLKLHNMRQRSDQSARQLLHEIEAVEQDIPVEMGEEARRAWHFLNSLVPQLRNAIMADIKEVTSRDQILSAAQRQEDLYQERKATRERLPAKSMRGSGAGQAKPNFGRQSSKAVYTEVIETEKKPFATQRAATHKERRETGACFVCGSKEHLSHFHDRSERSKPAGESQAKGPGRAYSPKK